MGVIGSPRRSELLAPGDEVRLAVRVLPGCGSRSDTRITHVDADGMTSVLARGPLQALAHVVTLTPSPVGTWLRDELRWTGPFGPLGRLADRRAASGRLLQVVLAARAEVSRRGPKRSRPAPAVVATALVRDGRVLVAQRTRPPALAGRWELPGGRVEPGEDEPAAVVRECREELGTEVVADGRVGTDLPIDVGRAARPPGPARRRTRPSRGRWSTSAVRWVDAAEVPAVDWVDADRAVVADLRPAPHRGREPRRSTTAVDSRAEA